MSDGASMLLNVDNCYVIADDGSIEPNFATGKLQVESESGGPSVRVIFVAAQDNRILVALPFSSWHRTVASRVLDAGSLKKPVALEVAACREDDRATPVEDKALKIWMGYFQTDYAALVDEFSLIFDRCEHDFGEEGLLPLPAALRELASEHFAFLSANEELVLPQEEFGSENLDVRVSKLEELLGKMHMDILKLAGEPIETQPPRRAATSKAKSSRPPAMKQTKTPAQKNPEGITTHLDYPDLDPSVVTAALQAGIEKKTLEEMQKLVNVNKKGAAALKQATAAPLADPLSESEGEEEQKDDSGSPKDVGDPMQVALTKLTKIVSHLALSKSSRGTKLEQALDGVSTTAESSSSTSGTKRSAAARRALRLALTESPADIYQLLERLMQEDVECHSLEPGLEASTTFTARGWVEHRSHIGAYKAVAHCSWGAAGILDSLRKGRTSEARARAALLLLQIDQSCVDKGNWALAAELALENPPPFHNLVNHSPPDIGNGDLPFSKILDPRWAEVTLAFLKDRDEYIHRRRAIGRPQNPGLVGEEEDREPRRRPKPKAKAKATPEA